MDFVPLETSIKLTVKLLTTEVKQVPSRVARVGAS